MNIRTKILLWFTSVVGVIILCLNIYIYLLCQSFFRNYFYKELKDRAVIAASVFLEKDEVSTIEFKKVENVYLNTLPHENIRIYDRDNHPVFIDSTDVCSFDESLINVVRNRKEYDARIKDKQIVGIHYADNQGEYVVMVEAVDDSGNAKLDLLLNIQIIGFVITLLIVIIAGNVFTSWILRPVSEVIKGTNKISETNLHLRLDEGNGIDEIAQLSITINRMLERLEQAFEQRKSFVANASHELRTPLTSIIGHLEVELTRLRSQEEYQDTLKFILTEAERLQALSNGLLLLAQSNAVSESFQKEEIRIDELILETIDDIRVKRPDARIALHFPEMPDDSDKLILHGDKNILQIAFLNILDNACKFSAGGDVRVELRLSDAEIEYCVTDTGIGISREDLPHITETFYRARNAGRFPGSGIGLSLVQRIIKMHHGKITINSTEGKGTCVIVTLNRFVR